MSYSQRLIETMEVKVSFVLLTATSLLFGYGESLRCYTCNGQLQPGQTLPCEVPTGNPTTVPVEACPAGDQVCVRYKSTNTASGSPVESIFRRCGAANICDTLKASDNQYNKLTECKTCRQDACDSGEFFSFSVVLLAIGVVLNKLF